MASYQNDGELGLGGFSKRVGALPTYPMAELPAIKRKLIEQGVDLIDVGAGDADFPPPDVAVKAVARALQDPTMSRYAFQRGLPAFREAAAAYMRRRAGNTISCSPTTIRIARSRSTAMSRRRSSRFRARWTSRSSFTRCRRASA